MNVPAAASLRWLWLPGLALFFLLYLSWQLWGRSDPLERITLGALTIAYTGMLCAGVAHWTAGRGEGAAGRVWNGLALGLALNTAGILVVFLLPVQWTVVSSILRSLATILLVLGVMGLPRRPRPRSGRLRLLWDVLLTSAAWLTLFWVAFLQSGLQSPSHGSSFIFHLAAFGDIGLVLLLICLFLISDVEEHFAPFAGFLLAFGAWFSSDLALAGLLPLGEVLPGNMLDLGWVMGAVLVLAAILPVIFSQPGKWPEWLQNWLTRLQGLLPLLSVLVLGWYALVDWQINGRFDPLALWVTVILSLGLIARQGVRAGEVEYEQYATLVNSVAEPVFICDSRGFLRLINPAMLQVIGLSEPADLLGNALGKVVNLPPGLDSYGKLHRAGGFSIETSLLRRDGGEVPVFLSLRPIRTGGKERMALAGTLHDLSLQKSQQSSLESALSALGDANKALEALTSRLEEKVKEKTASLSQALERLEEQNLALQRLDQLKSDFVAMVSHELRAPLTNITAGIELLLAGGSASANRRAETLSRVQAEIRRLTHYVETILDLSALEAGRMPLYPAPLALPALVESLQVQFEGRPGAGRIFWQVPVEMPAVYADEQALTSVLFHLLDNALKYAPEGAITLQAEVEGGWGVLSVRDHGPGIPEEALEMVFDRFYRYNPDDSQTVYGHGLGLYIVWRLMEAMGGKVTAFNHPEGGACFQCRLPVINESEIESGFEDPAGG